MKIAIPVAAGKLSAHFGHCEEFAIFESIHRARPSSTRKRTSRGP